MLLGNKKIICIPLHFHQGKYVIDFKKKVELFNSFFVKQCSIIQKSSKRPLILRKKNPQKSNSSITFNCNNDIATIICNLDPNKAHAYDIRDILLLKLLQLIFQFCIKHGKFPNDWKVADMVPVYKKTDEQILKFYRPVSALPFFEMFLRVSYLIVFFEYFIGNDLISQDESGFKPGDSFTNQ